ncbi:MAG: hypothetical protein RLZZ330_103 [Actinomycetota bacterium]|jgi:heme/copper-type cytochrome/quinol oxidase subunit 2
MQNKMKYVSKFFYFLLVSLFTSVSPAFANMADAGEETGAGLSALETIIWFFVTPATVWVVVWFLWSIPKWRKNGAPQTGDNWNPKPNSELVQK